MLDIFSCACWLSVCLPWKNIKSTLSTFKSVVSFLLLLSCMRSLYILDISPLLADSSLVRAQSSLGALPLFSSTAESALLLVLVLRAPGLWILSPKSRGARHLLSTFLWKSPPQHHNLDPHGKVSHPGPFCLASWFTDSHLTIGLCRASQLAQMINSLPAMQETWVGSLGWKDPLEKEMAPHSSMVAQRIPWTEETGGLWSLGLQRVGHDCSN